jgi:serpin B
MIRSAAALLTLGLTLAMTAPSPARTEVAIDDLERGAAQANNEMALDLFTKLRSEKGNLAFSPLSIGAALGMTEAGARGQTAEQMRTVLHWDNTVRFRNAGSAEILLQHLRQQDKNGPELHIANALWGQSGFPISERFLGHTAGAWGGKFDQLDFAKPDAAAKTINAWVEKQTRDRIKNLVPPASLNDLTRLVLTNAVYFKGKWESTFDADATHDAPFTTAEGKEVKAKTMQQSAFSA